MKATYSKPHQNGGCPAIPFMSVSDIAKQLDVSEKTVRRLITGRVLKALRIGRNLRVTPEDFQSYLQSCR